MEGAINYIQDPKGVMEKHKLYSPEFKERLELGFSRDIADIFKERQAERLAGEDVTLSERFLSGIRFADKHTVAMVMQ